MFQYAAGRRLAHHHHAELKLDISFFETEQEGATKRFYELRHLNINAAIASPQAIREMNGLSKNRLQALIVRFRQKVGLNELRRNVYQEPYFNFAQEFLDLPDNIYLNGFWQSDKYFKDIETIIRQEFTIKHAITGKNRELADFIQSRECISLHVRCGDYISDPKTMTFHGACGPDYYSKCVQQVAKMVKEPFFIVFSDDPVWAKEHLNIQYPSMLVDHNSADKGYEDLRLMNLCKHNIIANSSFSWWGAWLNNNPEKIVIAPKKWFNNNTVNTNDLIPIQWITI